MSRREHERGATLVIAGFAFVLLVIIAATVIDLAAARGDRASNQVVADSAAAAAARELDLLGGPGACELALGYVEEHISGASASGIDCSALPQSCHAGTPTATTTGTVGSITITLVHPVPNSHPLMTGGAIGASSQTVGPDDGIACDRFAVQILSVHNTVFGRAVGTDTLNTSIHAVALTGIDEGITKAINLLMLERHDCDVLAVAGGGGSQGGIVVRPFIDDINGRVLPGRINVDSDGTGACTSKGVITAGGTGAVIRADGPPGCDVELTLIGPGAGCGDLEVVAPGASGCQMPACSSTGLVAPEPSQVGERLTRAAVDWRYNCKAAYPVSLDIRGCRFAGTTPPYIDSLVAQAGGSGIPPGFSSYKGAGYPCSTSGSLQIPAGNWVVDCNLFRVSDPVVFKGGNIIFDGDVKLFGSSSLTFNSSNSNSWSWTENDLFSITEHSGQGSFVFLRDGVMSKGAQATIELDKTMLYVSPTSELDVGGGSGSLTWSAPVTGPFEDLALWSESSVEHAFGGGSSLGLEGVLFAPNAYFGYSGNGSQQQVAAQFISLGLRTNGAGLLAIQPVASRAVLLPSSVAILIR
jgi:hypothetical protein